jgi:hypothetical protein
VTRQNYGPEVWQELPEDWIEGLDVNTQVLPLRMLASISGFSFSGSVNFDQFVSVS